MVTHRDNKLILNGVHSFEIYKKNYNALLKYGLLTSDAICYEPLKLFVGQRKKSHVHF